MHHTAHPLSGDQQELLASLAPSRARLSRLAEVGAFDRAALWEIANREADATLALSPLPRDPIEHVLAAHRQARPYLERLAHHDPAIEVVVDASHRFTPRKILRRVLDHALDHLNQIDQWLLWQTAGIVPEATDGWADSAQTLEEDQLPLSAADLHAWLWRIDITPALVAQRASQLRAEQLDWMPPAPPASEGGWSLRQALHHLAAAERYYAIWMEEALPDDPIARYLEANRRFSDAAYQALTTPPRRDLCLLDDNLQVTTAQEIIKSMLLAEGDLCVKA